MVQMSHLATVAAETTAPQPSDLPTQSNHRTFVHFLTESENPLYPLWHKGPRAARGDFSQSVSKKGVKAVDISRHEHARSLPNRCNRARMATA